MIDNEPPPTGEPVDLPAPYDTSKWEQDPAGNWHRKSRAGQAAVWAVILAVAFGLLGWNVWSAHQEDLEQERRTEELTCALLGGYDC